MKVRIKPAPVNAGAPLILMTLTFVGGLAIGALFVSDSPIEARVEPSPSPLVATEYTPPAVRVVPAGQQTFQLTVQASGVVTPGVVSQLAAEVPGRVIWVAPNLVVGGRFAAGDSIVQIDPRDYELQVARAEAALEKAKAQLQTEEQKAIVARQEWALIEDGSPSSLALHEPQLANARAVVSEAETLLRQARLDLERTVVKVPFTGRVRDKQIGVGHYVNRGTPVAAFYSTDVAEVRLPIPDAELAFLWLPTDGAEGPAVKLRTTYAGREQVWTGRIVRTDGEVDARTGIVHAIAEVRNAFDGSAGAPMSVGMYVDAEISGKSITAVEVPVASLRDNSEVFVVDAEGLLHPRQVEVIQVELDTALVRGDIREGELVCLSAPATAIAGMKVRVQGR